MIKKSVFEEDLVQGMHRELIKNATSQDSEGVEKAIDYLNSAIDIFEDAGLQVQADKILNIILKIASDKHTKGLTPEKMVNNLKNHGTVFNMANDGKSNDLLNADLGEGLEVLEKDPEIEDFEDEKD